MSISHYSNFTSNAEKWAETVEKRKEAGKKGGVAKANNNKQTVANVANAKFATNEDSKRSNAKQTVANVADNVNVDVNVNVNDNVVSVVNNTQEQQKRQYVDLYTQNVAINLCNHPQAVLFIRTIKYQAQQKNTPYAVV